MQAAPASITNSPPALRERTARALAAVPVNIFGMVLGLGGLTSAWRGAEQLWGVPVSVSAALMTAVTALWVGCLLVLVLKWWFARAAAWVELRSPGKFAFYALMPMSTLVLSLVWRASSPGFALGLFVCGLLLQTVVAVTSTANLWRGGRQLETMDSALLMPAVGGCFVAAAACAGHGIIDLGVLYFGAGLGSWLITESVVLQRLAQHPLPAPKRATLGIHLTPAAIASVAYLAMTEGTPDLFSQMLFGYAMLQAFVTLRIVPWLREQSFALGAWAYTFGISALSLSAIRFGLRGQSGTIATLALPLFGIANTVIGWIAFRTSWDAIRALRHALR
jgi:tellurite resistance protein